MTTLSKADILSEIEAAFGRGEPPALLVERHEDWWKHREAHKYAEQVDVIRLFMNRPWWEVNPAYAYDERAAGDIEMAYLYLLPEAFVYYLPSLFILAIDEIETIPEKRRGFWAGDIEDQLDPNRLKRSFEERIVCFTPEQKRAVFHALEFIAQGYGDGSIKPEVIAYWSQFA